MLLRPDEGAIRECLKQYEYDPTNGTMSVGDISLRVPRERPYAFPRAGVRAASLDDLARQFPNGSLPNWRLMVGRSVFMRLAGRHDGEGVARGPRGRDRDGLGPGNAGQERTSVWDIGFEVRGLIPNYTVADTSCHYGVEIVWDNPDYRPVPMPLRVVPRRPAALRYQRPAHPVYRSA